MKLKVVIRHVGENDDWEEQLKVTSKSAASEELQEMVDDFNRIEIKSFGEKARLRELVSIGEEVKTPKEIQPKQEYNFRPLYTPSDYLCEHCEHDAECTRDPLCRAYDILFEMAQKEI